MLPVKNYIITLFFLLLTLSVFAQNNGKRIFTINGPEGDEPKILSLYQNKQGFILIGTTKGLYNFDGTEFNKYSADAKNVSGAVTAIREINKDELWLGFEDGSLAKVEHDHIKPLVFEEGNPKKAIKKIVEDKAGIIWIATAGEGVYYLKDKHMYNINEDDGLSDNYVYDISPSNDGTIRATTDRGLNIISLTGNKKSIKVFSSKDGLPDNILRCIFPIPQSAFWLGMQDAGIICIDKNLSTNTAIKDWQYGQVNDVVATSSQVYIATEDKGLVVYDHDEKNNITTKVYQDEQLKKVSCLLRDRESNVWAAGDNMLMRTAGSTIEMLYSLPKTTIDKIHSVLAAKDGRIWFNNGNDLAYIKRNNDKWQEINYRLNIDDADISCLYEDKRNMIWVGTLGKGVFILDPENGKAKQIKEDSLLANSNVISISGKDSIIWISSFEGIVRATINSDAINYTNYTDIKDIGSNYINYILPDSKNRLWFATDGKGLKLCANDNFQNIQEQTKKFGNVVYRVLEDTYNNIWFSTYKNGIVKHSDSLWTNITTAQGLSDMNVLGLAYTKGNIIAIHKNKLDIINAKTGFITYIDDEQGIGNINADFNAYSTDANGNLYFISDTFICRYHSSSFTALQPTILIDNVQLFLENIYVKNKHKFSYNENNISFHYTGLYYSQPDKLTYQYKLEGYDKNWVNTKDKTKNFPLLPPGTYTFRVRAALNNNFSAAPEANFTFTIERPFWMNTWLIIFCVLAIIAIVYIIIKNREKSINKLNALERDKIRSQLETLRSQINPHFLFNSFNTLISEIEDDPATAVTYVEKLSDFYRSIVMNREKDLILLKEEMTIMQDYAFIQRKRYGSAIQVTNSITEEQQKTYYITPLALQLLVENAIKHNVVSLEKPLTLSLYIDEEEYLVVKNSISKKLQEEKGSRMGLQNIQKRYELISPRPVVIEKDEHYFTVKIPLLKNTI